MANGDRKVGYYAVAGIMIAVIMIASMFLSGVKFPGIGGPSLETGMLVVLLKDAPANLSNLWVTIDSFSVHTVEEAWLDVPFGEGQTEVSFDLLTLHNVTLKLANATLPAGNYTKMRMTIKEANATFTGDPLPVVLTVPPGHVDIIVHFEVEPSDVVVVLIDMEADWVAISQNQHLRPVLKATVAGE